MPRAVGREFTGIRPLEASTMSTMGCNSALVLTVKNIGMMYGGLLESLGRTLRKKRGPIEMWQVLPGGVVP